MTWLLPTNTSVGPAKLAATIIMLAGCASTHTVYATNKEEILSTFRVTCNNPYQLTQDCSNAMGANILIS